MAGILSSIFGAPQQAPVQAQGRPGGFREMMAPDVMMPIAAGLLSGRSNAEGFANAFGAMGQGLGQKRQRNKTLEFLRQNDPEVAQLVEAGLEVKDAYQIHQQRVKAQAPDSTSGMQEYQFARSQGYDGSFMDYQQAMKKAGSTNIVMPGQPTIGTVPQGWAATKDEAGNWSMAPIAGGPEDPTQANQARAQNLATSTDTITKAAGRARKIATESGRWATGLGGQIIGETFGIGESSAGELRDQVAVLQANAKIENLQAMRAASPTGGALGAVSDSENAMLAAKAGALNPNAHPDVFQQQLDDYELSLLRVIHGYDAGTQIFEQSRQQNPDYYSKYGLEQ